MKLFVILSLCAAAYAYSDVDDNFSFDDMIKNRAGIEKNLDCFLFTAPCPPVLVKFRDHTLEAITDACNECNDIEKHDLVVFIKAMKSFPDKFKQLEALYDPDGSHVAAVEEKLKGYLKTGKS